MASLAVPAATATPTKPAGEKPPRRAALADISNDSSPVVGLAGGVLKTPPPSSRKNSSSGESLLREQAKSMLGTPAPAASAEETRFTAEDAKESCQQVQVLAAADGPGGSLVAGAVAVEPVMSTVEGEREGVEEEAADLTDSSSVVTSEDGGSAGAGISSGGSKCADDDCSLMWSVQANASCLMEEAGGGGEEEEEGDEESYDAGEEVYYEVEEEWGYSEDEEEACGGCDVLDGLCERLSRLTFAGKHRRFVYDSDGEMMEGEEVSGGVVSPGKVLLKGMPVPQGKHLRFSEEDDES